MRTDRKQQGGRRLTAAATSAVAVVLAVVLVGCNGPVVAVKPVTTFGSGGVLTLTVPDGPLEAAALPDGGLALLNTSTGRLDRRTATGAVAAGWTPPTVTPYRGFLAGLKDGSVLVATTEGGHDVIARFDGTGDRVPGATSVLSDGVHRFGLSPAGLLAVSSACAGSTGCDTVRVDLFRADGSLVRRTDASFGEIRRRPCTGSVPTGAVLAHDDGSVHVAVGSCFTPGGTDTIGTSVRHLTKTGAVDSTYGGGLGYGVMPQDGVATVLNDGGELLNLGYNGALDRLDANGRVDATWPATNTSSLVGTGPGTALVANSSGYTLASATTPSGCGASTPGKVVHLGPDAKNLGSYSPTASIPGNRLLRYPNGDLLLMGSSATSGSGGSCVGPRTYRFLKLKA